MEGTGDGAGESEGTGEKEGEDGTAGEEGGEDRAGGEEGAGVRAGGGDEGSEVGGGAGVVATEGGGSGLDCLTGLSTSFSSILFVKVGVGGWEVGTPGVGTSATLWEGEDLTGLDGVGLPVPEEAPTRRLGITVKELRDCRRRFARARAWVSESGIRVRSGFGEGRISKSDEERDTLNDMGLEGDSARTRRVSGEHGTLGLGGTSEPSQSLSRTGLVCPLSGSSAPRPPLSSNR